MQRDTILRICQRFVECVQNPNLPRRGQVLVRLTRRNVAVRGHESKQKQKPFSPDGADGVDQCYILSSSHDKQ
jgi:hypothetical protein